MSQFWPLVKQVSYFEAVGREVNIGLSLKPNNHKQILPIIDNDSKKKSSILEIVFPLLI